ncbi:integral membrane protein [Streptomyces albus]|uniref:Integral membrane protein n=2 Tax=Streptomyces TaxID=1883 RepID=A0A0B5EPH7_STRA4|nr:integral membrane protein [Streptomyces albus]AOU77773.1 integral membrane protein [Streptomyces albus]AYN33534.1 integral membrane protein [Streptomyces albus]
MSKRTRPTAGTPEEAAAAVRTPQGAAATATMTAPATGTGAEAADTPGAAKGPRPLNSPATKGGSSTTASPPPSVNRLLARAALLTAVFSAAGSLLGLVRDQTLAQLFGAGPGTDAFLVAWTVPELASTLLIEEGLAFAMVPAFSVALSRRARGERAAGGGDPVRALVAASLPRLALWLTGVGALLIATAPLLVDLLAPGLDDPGLAVDCTRLTATSLLSFGLTGYCSAALRAHRSFLAPATIYVAYNTGIITALFVCGGRWGVASAAVGVAVGGCLMVAVQAPSLWRRLRTGEAAPPAAPGSGARTAEETTAPPNEPQRGAGWPVDGGLLLTVLLFAAVRQSQVFIERFLASGLPAGAISHLNYAQKICQLPMVLSLMLCTVTFPVVARAVADGDTEAARDRVERDLLLAASVVLLGAAAVVASAPQLVQLLFQRGAFTAADTSATAGVMRVYAAGLLGHTLVGALIRAYFSGNRRAWYPVAAMAAGAAATGLLGALAVGPFGVRGIAAANAAGITLTAALLLYGCTRTVPLRTGRVAAALLCPLGGAVAAAAAGLAAAPLLGSLGATDPTAALALQLPLITLVFAAVTCLLGRRGFPALSVRLPRLGRPAPHPARPADEPTATATDDAAPTDRKSADVR